MNGPSLRPERKARARAAAGAQAMSGTPAPISPTMPSLSTKRHPSLCSDTTSSPGAGKDVAPDAAARGISAGLSARNVGVEPGRDGRGHLGDGVRVGTGAPRGSRREGRLRRRSGRRIADHTGRDLEGGARDRHASRGRGGGGSGGNAWAGRKDNRDRAIVQATFIAASRRRTSRSSTNTLPGKRHKSNVPKGSARLPNPSASALSNFHLQRPAKASSTSAMTPRPLTVLRRDLHPHYTCVGRPGRRSNAGSVHGFSQLSGRP